MKKTGIRKFPEIPAHWAVARVKYIATLSHGSDPKTEGDIPVYGSGDRAFKSCGEFKEGPVVLLGRKGSLETPHYIEGRYWNVDTAFDARVKPGNDLRWFYYLAQCFDYSLYMAQTTLPSMTQSDYYAMQIPLPPLAEQRAIVAFLDGRCGAIDAVVAAKERERALLKELKKAVIAEAVTGGVSSEASFSSDSRDSSFSSNSRNSRNSRTSSASRTSSPSSPASRKTKPTGIAWLPEVPEEWEIRRNASCFKPVREIVGADSATTPLLSLTTKGVRVKGAEETGGKRPESFDGYQIAMPDDIVLCLFDLDCSAVFSGLNHWRGMISPAYKVVRCSNDILPRYADYWFRYVAIGRKFKAFSKSLRYTLTINEFGVLPIPLPPLAEQRAIVAFLDGRCGAIDAAEAALAREVAALKELKRATIAEAVTKGVCPSRVARKGVA